MSNTERGQEEVAAILRDNIHFSGQVGDYVIHRAIEKLLERERKLAIGFVLFKERFANGKLYAHDGKYYDSWVEISTGKRARNLDELYDLYLQSLNTHQS